ncbi:MAG: biopolymer transporter ExbD [Spirochaetaceae bacterium]|nr:biopolymer transporter ExbD [Spirochaetaceae bacterium]
MKLKRRRRHGIADSSASSDIAFLLIIYFLVIAGFTVNKGFLLGLPAKESTRIVKPQNVIRFRLDKDGTLWYKDAPLDFSGAEQELRGLFGEEPDQSDMVVSLSIASQAPWQSVVSFVELLQAKIGIQSFSFKMDESG